MSNSAKINQHQVSVRALADFGQREGDLISSFRPSPSAFEGQATHKLTQAKRNSNYQREVSLSALWQREHFDLRISGRADGVFDNGIEEIKTSRIPPQEIPDVAKALALQQAKIYAALTILSFCHYQDMDVIVTYVHPQTLQEWPISKRYSAHELLDNFVSLCAQYDQWLTKLNQHKKARYKFLNALSFPYPVMRTSQRQMAEDVYKSCCTGKHLTAEAPTGTGKTLAAIFPALKSFNKTGIESLFFLTMKTTGKIAALDALTKLDPEHQLSSVFLSAKHRMCLNEDTICDGQFCPYAKNYFQKRHKLQENILQPQQWHDDALMKLGQEEEICPYYLSQDWAIWADVVVGDLNYIYDTTAVQPYLLKEINNRATVLIDESHNLIDRGRMIYSTDFNGKLLQSLLKETPTGIQKKLRKIQHQLREACKESNQPLSYEPPNNLIQTLKDFNAQSATLLREQSSFEPSENWQAFIFSLARFTRLNDLANQEDFCWRYHQGTPEQRRIELICLNPSKLLQTKHDILNNVVAFSATLKPWSYSNQLNGLPQAVVSELASPFSPHQFDVFIANNISTRFKDKAALPQAIKSTLQRIIDSTENSMIFFSSYQQMDSCLNVLTPNPSTLIQQRDWDNQTREQVLSQFRESSGITLFSVLGGVFSEGIDLPGQQLSKVVIIGPGLPQVNTINNEIKQRMAAAGHSGFNFAYVFPGLQKVLQAAGRCVRTETDQGKILLIDDRFEEYYLAGWLPSHWSISCGEISKWQAK